MLGWGVDNSFDLALRVRKPDEWQFTEVVRVGSDLGHHSFKL
jgi:hypothetical protein